MFNIGGGEVLVISIIALIVLGPTRLPQAARQVGKAMGELRRLSSGFQNELQSALNDSERPAAAPRRDVLAGGTSSLSAASTGDEAQDAAPPVGAVVEPTGKPRRRQPLRAEPAKPRPGAKGS